MGWSLNLQALMLPLCLTVLANY